VVRTYGHVYHALFFVDTLIRVSAKGTLLHPGYVGGFVALNIKNPAIDQLAGEVAQALGVTKTEAVRRGLELLAQRMGDERTMSHGEHLMMVLQHEVWPDVPDGVLGAPIDKAERERILGFGEAGV